VLDLKIFSRKDENVLSYDLMRNWQGDIRVHAEAVAPCLVRCHPFVVTVEAILLLPMTGFFGKERVNGFRITHPALQPQSLKPPELKVPFNLQDPVMVNLYFNPLAEHVILRPADFRPRMGGWEVGNRVWFEQSFVPIAFGVGLWCVPGSIAEGIV